MLFNTPPVKCYTWHNGDHFFVNTDKVVCDDFTFSVLFAVSVICLDKFVKFGVLFLKFKKQFFDLQEFA